MDNGLLQYLHILYLLFTPCEPDLPMLAGPEQWKALKAAALHFELVGPKEAWVDNWKSEVGYCRKALRETANCPPLSASCMLPDHKTIQARIAFNEACMEHWNTQLREQPHRQHEIVPILEDLSWRREAWATARVVRTPAVWWKVKRIALGEIMERGGLPLHVDPKFFREVP